MRSVAMAIGGARLQADSGDATLALALTATQQAFACDPGDADIHLTVSRAGPAPDPGPTARLLFRSGGLWELHEDDAGLLVRLVSPAFGPCAYRTVSLDRRFRRGRLILHGETPGARPHQPTVEPFEYPLDELLMTNWLAQGRGVELHACGIVDDDGQGMIFCGQSGAGKTTTSRLWQAARPHRPARILSDDRIVVRLEQGRVHMYGTPWHGEAALSEPSRVPCKGIFLLEKAPSAGLEPLGLSEAVARLFSCSIAPTHDRDALGFVLDFLAQLALQVPCRLLRFARDGAFVNLVRAATHAPSPVGGGAIR